eukprot:3058015-Rhodomonas_salina.3
MDTMKVGAISLILGTMRTEFVGFWNRFRRAAYQHVGCVLLCHVIADPLAHRLVDAYPGQYQALHSKCVAQLYPSTVPDMEYQTRSTIPRKRVSQKRESFLQPGSSVPKVSAGLFGLVVLAAYYKPGQ